MIFPGGKIVWQDLRLSFVSPKDLMLFLKTQEFYGSVHLVTPNNEGLILFQEGVVVYGIRRQSGKWETRNDHAEEILKAASRKQNGRLSVYSYSPEVVDILTQVCTLPVEMLHFDLSSDFTHIGKFVEQLQKQHFTGYLEIFPPVSNESAMEFILLKDGQIRAVLSRFFQGRVDNGKATDQRNINRLMPQMQKIGVHYSVYEATPPPEKEASS